MMMRKKQVFTVTDESTMAVDALIGINIEICETQSMETRNTIHLKKKTCFELYRQQ